MAKTSAGGKNRKYGRNSKWCDLYRVHSIRDKNKVIKLLNHLRRHPEDDKARGTLRGLRGDVPAQKITSRAQKRLNRKELEARKAGALIGLENHEGG